MKTWPLSILVIVLTACGTKDGAKVPNSAPESEAAILNLAAQLSSTVTWLKTLESGNTNELKMAMRSRLTVNAMMLEQYLKENPLSTNANVASNILKKVYASLGSTNTTHSTPDTTDQFEKLMREKFEVKPPGDEVNSKPQREVIKIPLH